MTTYRRLLCGLTALSLLAPLSSIASTSAFENGFYVGAKIGAQQMVTSWDRFSSFSAVDSSLIPAQLINAHPDEDVQSVQTNLMGNLGIGYGRVINKLFLAAEFSVNLATEQESSWQQTNSSIFGPDFEPNLETYTESLKSEITLKNPDIILDLRPGWLLAKNFLLYGRIGVAFNELSIEQEGDITLINSTGITNTISIASSEEKNVYGLRLGLGAEYKMTPSFGVSLDYVFTDYGSIDTEFTETDLISDPYTSQTLVTSKADVTKNTGTLGFNYYFGGKKQRPIYHGLDK